MHDVMMTTSSRFQTAKRSDVEYHRSRLRATGAQRGGGVRPIL